MSAIAIVPSRSRYSVLDVHAGVADVRIGQGDDLTAVARVSENFLIAGDRRVEHHLADRVTGRANRYAVKDRAVSEREYGGRQGGR
jgi:hypothetical protein